MIDNTKHFADNPVKKSEATYWHPSEAIQNTIVEFRFPCSVKNNEFMFRLY